jgi:peptidyl-prolyl cis-trans isomerase B (cyclophilin B)
MIDGVTHRLRVLRTSETILIDFAHMTKTIRYLAQSRVVALLTVFSVTAVALSACTSPPVAEFTPSRDSGNAPFEVSFVLGELADADNYSWDFGDGSGSSEVEPTHVFEFSGEFVVKLTAERGGTTDTAESIVTVEAGKAGWVVIESADHPIASFETAQFTANAFDELGNPVDDAEFVWSVDGSVGDIDQSGKFTARTDLGLFEDAISVEFERLGTTASSSASIEIIPGPLHSFSISPSVIDIQVGRSESIIVEAVDEAGHLLDSAFVLFTPVREGDTVDSTGLFKPTVAASGKDVELVTIEVELDGTVIEATISGTVRPGILDQIHVSSLPTTLRIGESYQLESYATDRFGNELVLDELKWSVTDTAVGSITESGLFTAGTTAGTHTENGIQVLGMLNDIESVTVTPVTIIAGAITAIHIVPDNDSVPIGAGSPFVVLATDGNGNILDIPEEEFIYEYSSAGRGNEVAVFIAGYEIGDFENAITVTLPTGVAGNEFDLVAQSDITIRQRSSNIIAVEVVDQDGGGIFFIDLETAQLGSADTSFHNNDAVELSPSWWPDGSRLVYATDVTGELQIHTLNLTTREIIQLTDITGGASMSDVSSDGKSIAFVGLGDDQWQLYVAPIPDDVATSPITLEDSTRISTDENAQHILPYWSPDSTQILASQNTSGGLVRVMMFDPSLQNQPQVLGPFGSVGFGWSIDGTGVHIGLATTGGALDLGTLDLETSNPEFIDTTLEFLVAAWSPDDTEVVAIDSLLGAGWLIDSDATGLRRVVDAEQAPTRMSWRPKAYGDPVEGPMIEGDPVMLADGDAPRAPVGALDTALNYTATISTDSGDIELELFDDVAPLTVENFVNLARVGFYDGLNFHRVISGFVSQAGDPDSGETDGPGYLFNDEFSRGLSHDAAGWLSMANAGANTNGSQFFITHTAATWLDPYVDGVAKNCADDLVSCHGIFGRVTAGLEIVTEMAERDPVTATTPGVTILGISISES